MKKSIRKPLLGVVTVAIASALAVPAMAWAADGYVAYKDANANGAYDEGETGYSDVWYAFYNNRNEADAVRIVLLEDSSTEYLTVQPNIELDLNGKTLTLTSAYNGVGISMYNNSSLTVNDTAGDGEIVATVGDGIKVGGGGGKAALTVNGGTIKATSDSENVTAVYVSKNSVLAIAGGLIDGGEYGAVLGGDNTTINVSGGTLSGETGISSHSAYSGTAVNITGGVVEGDVLGIYQPQNGSLVISGGKVTGQTGINVKSGSLSITGGMVEGTGEKAEYVFRSGGFASTGDAVVVESASEASSAYETPAVSISGGNLVSGNASAVTSYAASDDDAAVVGFVSGGTFVGEEVSADLVAPGNKVVEQDQGWTIGIDAETAVASVSGVGYASLQAAVDAAVAANGGTVTMIQDVKLTDGVEVEGEVYLDLNGCDVTASESWAGSDYMVVVEHGGCLTVTDPSDPSDAGSIDGGGTVMCGVKMTLAGGDDTSSAQLFVDGGAVKGASFGVAGNGSEGRGNTVVTVNGGEVSSNSPTAGAGIFNPQEGSVIVNAGKVSGPTGIEMRSGDLKVYGGEIFATAEPFSASKNGNGTTTTGAAVAVSQHTTNIAVSATVYGGTLSGSKALYEEDLEDESADDVSLAVSGGVFEGGISSENVEGFVTGGTFTDSSVEGYLADDLTLKVNPGGTYTVVEAYDSSATVTPSAPSTDEPEDEGCAEDAACNAFNDVDEGAWYHEVIDWAVAEGVLRGYVGADGELAGELGPLDELQRAQLLAMLHRIEGEPVAAAECTFSDVADGAWYAGVMAWAQQEGLIMGDAGKTTVRPTDDLTREELAVILWRWAEWKGLDVSAGEDTNVLSYVDADQISSWAMPAVQWAVAEGVISGYTDANDEPTGYIGPKDTAERAQVAAMLSRLDAKHGIV